MAGFSSDEPDRRQRPGLPARDRRLVETGDRVLVHAVEVEPRAEPQEGAAETDRRALEKHEYARDHEPAALGSQRPHDRADLAPAVCARAHAIGGGARSILENGAADEARPGGHRLEGSARELGKGPKPRSLRGE